MQNPSEPRQAGALSQDVEITPAMVPLPSAGHPFILVARPVFRFRHRRLNGTAWAERDGGF